MSNTKKTIAVDFDGTLADDSRVKYPECGPPVWRMVERVRRWIAEGHEVVLFTARLAEKDVHRERDQVKRLTEWLDLYGIHNTDGTVIAMTAWKLPKFDEFWDDKAVAVIRNTGSTYFEAEQYRENWRTPQDVTGNGAQLELQFGDSDYRSRSGLQGYHQERQGICTGSQGPSLGPVGQYVTGVDGRSYLRLDHATPGCASYTSFTTFEDLATDPREPYTR